MEGHRTPALLLPDHWGVFLFLIVCWMVWETRDWMANTPLSALRKLATACIQVVDRHAGLLAWLTFLGCAVAGLVYPARGVPHRLVGAAAGSLGRGAAAAPWTCRMPSASCLFLVGTGLTLTLMVELIVLVGDIGRMNTVFKFYLQVWTLLLDQRRGCAGLAAAGSACLAARAGGSPGR